jgi:hypothetical protein
MLFKIHLNQFAPLDLIIISDDHVHNQSNSSRRRQGDKMQCVTTTITRIVETTIVLRNDVDVTHCTCAINLILTEGSWAPGRGTEENSSAHQIMLSVHLVHPDKFAGKRWGQLHRWPF